MELEWDEAERVAKHGLDFADTPKLNRDNATHIKDRRKNYIEPRYWVFAMLSKRLHMAAFCRRGAKIRIISFRKANDRKMNRYGPQT